MNFGPSVLLLIAGCALLPFSGRWQVLNGVWLIANVWGAVSFFLSGEVGWAALVGAIAVWIAWDMCRDLSQRFRSHTAPIKPALVKLVGLSWTVLIYFAAGFFVAYLLSVLFTPAFIE